MRGGLQAVPSQGGGAVEGSVVVAESRAQHNPTPSPPRKEGGRSTWISSSSSSTSSRKRTSSTRLLSLWMLLPREPAHNPTDRARCHLSSYSARCAPCCERATARAPLYPSRTVATPLRSRWQRRRGKPNPGSTSLDRNLERQRLGARRGASPPAMRLGGGPSMSTLRVIQRHTFSQL